jgi:hypothetical protein
VRDGDLGSIAAAVGLEYAGRSWEAPRSFRALPGNGAERLL